MTAKISASSDGTKVNIGTAAEDALRIDSVAKTIAAVAPYALNASNALGVGQTWQDVKSSRSINTSYVNVTGRPIFVACSATATVVGDGVADFKIDGITVMRGGVSMSGGTSLPRANFSAVIPADSTYEMTSVAGTMAVEYWGELK